ncbi:hypothetical protein PGB90_004895 [Kerria lacca]
MYGNRVTATFAGWRQIIIESGREGHLSAVLKETIPRSSSGSNETVDLEKKEIKKKSYGNAVVHDQTCAASIAGIIRESISPKAGIARFCVLRQLIELKASQNLLKLLVKQSVVDVHHSDPLLHELIWILGQLSQKVQFSNRMIKAGMTPIFLKIFSRWEKYDGKTRLKICNDTIVTLQHICVLKRGRSAIRRENGFLPMYKFCLSCPEDKVYDRLLTKVCSIINVCLQKKELPLSFSTSPAHFPLPIDVKTDSYTNIDSDDSDDEEVDMDDDANDVNTCNYDEEDSDSEKKIKLDSNSQTKKSPPALPVTTLYRTISDLQIYRNVFEEYYFFFYNGKHDIMTETGNENYCSKQSFECQEDDGYTEMFESASGSLTCGIPILDEIDERFMTQKSIYCRIASKVRSVIPFVKIAYPDLMGGDGIGVLQPFYVKDRKIGRSDQTLYASIDASNVHNYQNRYFKRTLQKRTKLVAGVDRGIYEETVYSNIVYDLDKLLYSSTYNHILKKLTNNDETRIGAKEYVTSTLNFESRFESGNLRKAIQIGAREYDLILTPDVNSSHHCQWFYFEISNMDNIAPYTFNIINCEKTNSQFNYGMKPILYSVREATLGRPGWFRAGTDICYYRNGYKIPHNNKQTFLTASFNIKFPHSLDICYLAYTFPYTYSHLMNRIRNWSLIAKRKDIYLRTNNLCDSLNQNAVPLLTITAPDTKENRITDREIVFLTSRVHPGEANSSWVIDGTISHLLNTSTSAKKLRNQYVFKIVPMLNVEGVINGW